MSWVAAAVAVGTTAYGAYNASQTPDNPSAVFGKKPQVAPYTPVDLGAETGKAVDANLSNYDSISALLNKVYPGFSDILKQGSDNTLSELRGELPADVQGQIQRSSAFQSLMGGYSGTGMASANTARNLGRTSLDLTTLGTNSAQLWAKLAEDASSPFIVSTAEQAGTTAANNAGQQATDQLKFNVEAAPDPAAAGLFNYDTAQNQKLLALLASQAGGFAGRSGQFVYDPRTGRYMPSNTAPVFNQTSTGVTQSAGGWNIDQYGNLIGGPGG